MPTASKNRWAGRLPWSGSARTGWRAIRAVILGKSFLTERGHGFEVVYDWNDDQDDDMGKGWVILTDYETQAS